MKELNKNELLKELSKKKFVLYPGYVISQYDGQKHYISAIQLARLYGVLFSECVVVYLDSLSSLKGRDLSGLMPLFPKEDGDYRLGK